MATAKKTAKKGAKPAKKAAKKGAKKAAKKGAKGVSVKGASLKIVAKSAKKPKKSCRSIAVTKKKKALICPK